GLRISPPIATPDPFEAPATLLQQQLAGDVTFTNATAAVIHGAVALDGEAIARGIAGADNGEVDPVPAHADLRVDFVATVGESPMHLLLEDAIELQRRTLAAWARPRSRLRDLDQE